MPFWVPRGKRTEWSEKVSYEPSGRKAFQAGVRSTKKVTGARGQFVHSIVNYVKDCDYYSEDDENTRMQDTTFYDY